MRRTADGQITVFFSLIMMCMFAFFCVLLESARTAGARWYPADGSFISDGFSIQSVSSEALGYLPGSVCRI